MLRSLFAAIALAVAAPSLAVPPALLSTPTPDPLRPRLIGADGRTSQSLIATSATLTTFESRCFFYVGADTPYVQLSLDNWAIDGSGADLVPPTALALAGAAIETGDASAFMPLYFSAARMTSIAAGKTMFSDPLYATAFGKPLFHRGEKYWVPVRGSVPADTGQIQGSGRQYNPTGMLASRFDPIAGINGTSQVDATGAMTSKTGQDSFGTPMCYTAAIGQPIYSRVPAIVATGTSIADGTGDTAGYARESQYGFISRASFNADGATRPVPMLNMARGSSLVGGATGAASTLARRAIYFRFATLAIDEYGSNDINSAGTGDVPTLEAAEQTLWSAETAAGIGTIIHTRLIPRNSSSDVWTTLANQTNTLVFDTNAQQFNDWLDTQVGVTISSVLPIASPRYDPAASGGTAPNANYWKWAINESAGHPTADRIHPATAIHILMPAELRSKLVALYPQIEVLP